MATSPASGPGGGSFNGGTITSPLEIDTGSGAAPSLVLGGDVSALGWLAAGTYGVSGEAEVSSSPSTGSVSTFSPNTANGFTMQAANAAGSSSFTYFESNATVVRMRRGYFSILNHAAPADADLSTGDCAFWFDQTNGAAKLMVKAKQANGTVVGAAIALS